MTLDDVCMVCGGSPSRPYRHLVEGRIVAGCVATIHDDHLPRLTNTSAWVSDAKKSFRAAGVKRLSGRAGR